MMNDQDKSKKSQKKIYESGKIRENMNNEFGEFVCSYYSWLPLNEQKKKARRLEDITDDIIENDEK